jgi:hypothetical protein
MSPTINHLESLVHLATSLRTPYSRVAKSVEALGIKPTVTINGIGHYDAEACERIADYLKERTN